MLKLKVEKYVDAILADMSARMKLDKPMKSGLQKQVSGNASPSSDLGDIQFDLENDDELQLYMSMYYKQAVELAQELSIQSVFNQGEMDEIRKRMIWDAIIYSKSAVRAYTSSYTGMPKYENYHLADISVSYAERADYKDMTAWKGVKWMTMNKFIELCGLSVTDEVVKEIFNYAVKNWGVINEKGLTVYQWNYSKINMIIFDRIRIPVAYIEIKSTDVLDYEVANTKDGRNKSRKLSKGSEKKQSGRKESGLIIGLKQFTRVTLSVA